MSRYFALILLIALSLMGCQGTSSAAVSTGLPTTVAAANTEQPADPPPSSPPPTATFAPPPTITPRPTLTPGGPTSTPTLPSPTATPTATPDPGRQLNGLPVADFVIMPQEVRDHVVEIAALGRRLGRNPYRFSKLGDSTTLKPPFMGFFDRGEYVLGPYEYLQPTIDYYQGSFDRVGVAARVGLHSWGVFDPLWAFKQWCEPNEDMLACEFRYNNPGLLWVRLGPNDNGAPSVFEYHLKEVIEYCLELGVIPVLVTKADRFEGPENTNNDIMRAAAAEFLVPLMEFDIVAGTLPNRGLGEDGVHLVPRYIPHDYTDPETFTSGHAVLDLTALLMLHEIHQALEE